MFDDQPREGDGRPIPHDDVILPFQVGDTAVRGRIVRLGPAVNEILTRHDFPHPVQGLLGEAAALVAMIGSSLKFDGKLILQAQGDGPVAMLVADYRVGGALRATATVAEDQLDVAAKAEGPEVHYLLRKGHMVMTIDQGPDMERYQGVVPLEGKDLATATVNYFGQSEQIPTAIRLAVGQVEVPGQGPQWRAGGIMVQFMAAEGGSRERGQEVLLADDDRESWNRAAALLETAQPDELLDPTLTPQTLLYRLYHEDGVRVFDPSSAHFECTCNRQKIANVLAQYEKEQIEDMIVDGAIDVTCDFCRQNYKFVLSEDGTEFLEE